MLPMAKCNAKRGTAGAQWGRFKTPAKHVENNALEACSGATTLNGPCALSLAAAQTMKRTTSSM